MTDTAVAPGDVNAKRLCLFCARSKNGHNVEMVKIGDLKLQGGEDVGVYSCPCCDRMSDGPVGKYISSNKQHPGWGEISDEAYDDSAPDGPTEGPSGPHELS